MKLLFSHNETPSIIITMEVDDLPIELEVADALKSGHLMMGTAESCTGGKIASMITSMAGSSEYFTGGVAYKERILSECYHFGENPRMENIRLSAEAALRMLLGLIRE